MQFGRPTSLGVVGKRANDEPICHGAASRPATLARLIGNEENAMTKPSIVFAHGIWADGSCFQRLIPTVNRRRFIEAPKIH